MKLFKPATMEASDGLYELQYNFCNNTFCKWYGKQQFKYVDVKSKPSRYKLGGTKATNVPVLECNDIQEDNSPGFVQGNATLTVSNWSLAEETKRLIEINTVIPVEPDYIFHKADCTNKDKTPFDDIKSFYRKGKSNTKSIRFQCKECKKCTNVLPEQDKCFNYHQKRNDILVNFAMDIMSRTPVKRTCEKLGIGSATYYNKLEWIYRKCLEFNQRHETEAFKSKVFDEIWLNTDMMIYNLNNIKFKGYGKKRNISTKEKKMPIYVVASADLKSGYVFRTDVAYANYNPKYAQQMLTIFRTFYNFCWKTKIGKSRMTPAQRIGIADKVYDIKDIIYFR